MQDPTNWQEFKEFMNKCRFVTYRIELSNEFEPDLIYVHESGELLYNVDTKRFLHPYSDHKGKKGRYSVDIWVGGKWIKTSVSRVVADAFMLNAKDKEHVHHIDGNKKNNAYWNLIYVTKKEHDELHALLNNGEEKKYWKRIKNLRKESPFYTHEPIFA